MKKHSLIFAAITIVAFITLACNALVSGPARPQGPQPEQPPQSLVQPFLQPGQPGPQPEQEQPFPGQQGPQPGEQRPVPSQPIQVDRMVDIPGAGGSAEITFDISNGEWVHIMLAAGNPAMQPYGSMQYPDGASVDCPPLNTTANGMNQVDILLTDNGRYTLTLFDGSNQGGPVSVKIVGSQ